MTSDIVVELSCPNLVKKKIVIIIIIIHVVSLIQAT